MDDHPVTVNPLRALLGGGPIPPIAVSFSDRSLDADIDAAQAGGLDVAELRIDRYASSEVGHVLTQVRRFDRFATLATIRTAAEGGCWTASEQERADLFRSVMPYVDGIDVELTSATSMSSVIDEAVAGDHVLIISNHDFESTPSLHELESIAQQGKELGADVVKLSAMAHSQHDLRTLASFTLQKAEIGLIVIAMGDHGTASRVFFPALGSRLTYAYTSDRVSGQLPFQTTFERLREFYPEFDERKARELRTADRT